MSIYTNLLDAKKMRAYSNANIQGKMQQVLIAVYQADDNGLTTREVADICDLSVYSARNWLMKLENEEYIVKKTKPRSTTWHRI